MLLAILAHRINEFSHLANSPNLTWQEQRSSKVSGNKQVNGRGSSSEAGQPSIRENLRHLRIQEEAAVFRAKGRSGSYSQSG